MDVMSSELNRSNSANSITSNDISLMMYLLAQGATLDAEVCLLDKKILINAMQ